MVDDLPAFLIWNNDAASGRRGLTVDVFFWNLFLVIGPIVCLFHLTVWWVERRRRKKLNKLFPYRYEDKRREPRGDVQEIHASTFLLGNTEPAKNKISIRAENETATERGSPYSGVPQ